MRRAAAVTAASVVRPSFVALTRWSVNSVEPISMSVALLSAHAAAASFDGAFAGGPSRLWTAPQSVVMMACGLHVCFTSVLRTNELAHDGWPLTAL